MCRRLRRPTHCTEQPQHGLPVSLACAQPCLWPVCFISSLARLIFSLTACLPCRHCSILHCFPCHSISRPVGAAAVLCDNTATIPSASVFLQSVTQAHDENKLAAQRQIMYGCPGRRYYAGRLLCLARCCCSCSHWLRSTMCLQQGEQTPGHCCLRQPGNDAIWIMHASKQKAGSTACLIITKCLRCWGSGRRAGSPSACGRARERTGRRN